MELIAISSLLVIVYTYIGYPLLVAGLSRLFPWRPQRDATYVPTVSVCIAVHDGANYLDAKLENLLALDYPPDKLEILVYSDGSTDRTEQIVRRYGERDRRIRLLSSAQRHGKPAAINALREAAHGEVLLMTDVRPPLARHTLRALASVLADRAVGCVSGNLVLAGAEGSGVYWRYERFIRASEARLFGLVGVSGTIYAIRRQDLAELPPNVLLDDMWIPLRLAIKKRLRIALCEEAEAYDVAFADGREFERKARTLAGNFQLLTLMPELLVPRLNPVWFQMVSHKLLRLLCPLALAGLFVCTTWILLSEGETRIPIQAWQGLFAAQLLLYSLAALGPRAGRSGRLARTFAVLNAAAVAGFWRFAHGSQRVTW